MRTMRAVADVLFFYFAGLGFAKVQIELSIKNAVGESSKLQCLITSENEILEDCDIYWSTVGIKNETKEINKDPKYEHRVSIQSITHTKSLMTLKEQTGDDTDDLVCNAICIVNRDMQRIQGKPIKLQDLERPQPEVTGVPTAVSNMSATIPVLVENKLKYLFFTFNLFIFIAVTVICVLVVRKQRRRKKAQTPV